MSEIKPPVKNARYNSITILGKPKISPKTAANLTSPKPIPFLLVRTKIKKKKTNEKIKLKRWLNGLGFKAA